MPENLRIDHVTLGAKDLGATAEWLESVSVLRTTDAWNFPGGLANRIAHSGGAAIEILGVGFPGMEMISALNAQIYARTIRSDCWLAWALVSDEIDATAARLGLEVVDGAALSSVTGEPVTWRMCGHVEAFFSEPYLPFFLSYTSEDEARRTQTDQSFDIARIKITGDADRFAQWVDGAAFPVEVRSGPPSIDMVAITTDGREIELRPDERSSENVSNEGGVLT